MTNYTTTLEENTIKVSEVYDKGTELVAKVTADGELGEIVSVKFGFEGFVPVTPERLNELAQAPISQVFLTGTPESGSEHTAVGLIDRARFALAKEKLGKPNFVAMTHKESSRTYFQEIVPGMGGSFRIGSDVYPCIVTKVSKSGSQITTQQVRASATDKSSYFGDQDYTFDPTPIGEPVVVRRGKYQWKHKMFVYSFDGFAKFQDPTF